MKIIYLSATSAGMHQHGIYFDLLQEFVEAGHDVTIVYARERRDKLETEKYKLHGITYLGIKTGNITKNKNMIEKSFATLTIDRKFLKEIKEYFPNKIFDLVLYSTPPITFDKTIRYFKESDAFLYLMLKDIFPQNAIDIGLFGKYGLINRYFKRKEKKLYKNSDMIGVMSLANKEFLVNRDASLKPKIELFPNALKISSHTNSLKREDFGLDDNDMILLYGGNLGLPQGIPFILQCMKKLEEEKNIKLVICGTGSEAYKISNEISKSNLKNTIYLGQLPAKKYQSLVRLSDIGLIFLDHRFTVPNFPQRILNYMEESKPLLLATDPNTDIGTIATDNNFGVYVESNNVDKWHDKIKEYYEFPERRISMGENAYTFIKDNYDVEKTYKIILAHF